MFVWGFSRVRVFCKSVHDRDNCSLYMASRVYRSTYRVPLTFQVHPNAREGMMERKSATSVGLGV